MNRTKPLSGTYEWAGDTVNIQLGCEHNCRYCYARYDAVERFHKCSSEDWVKPVIKFDRDKKYPKYNGLVMFPSTHDITPKNIDVCMEVLHKLLAAGNRVLIVSKPHWPCVTRMCDNLSVFRDQILFRLTIGSTYNKVLEFFEPGAPNFTERISCLQYAHASGFETSVSAEPYLDPYVMNLVEAVSDWVSETIWIGRMNKIKRRLDLTDVTDDQMRKFVEPMLVASGDEFVKIIYELLKENPMIRWKDSVRKVMGI